MHAVTIWRNGAITIVAHTTEFFGVFIVSWDSHEIYWQLFHVSSFGFFLKGLPHHIIFLHLPLILFSHTATLMSSNSSMCPVSGLALDLLPVVWSPASFCDIFSVPPLHMSKPSQSGFSGFTSKHRKCAAQDLKCHGLNEIIGPIVGGMKVLEMLLRFDSVVVMLGAA